MVAVVAEGGVAGGVVGAGTIAGEVGWEAAAGRGRVRLGGVVD